MLRTPYKRLFVGRAHVTSDFQTSVDIADLRSWIRDIGSKPWRLVQYCGVELVGTLDLPSEEVEGQVSGLLREGFRVDWVIHDLAFYLRVYEPDGPEPPWESVFREAHLADISEILSEAGFGSENAQHGA